MRLETPSLAEIYNETASEWVSGSEGVEVGEGVCMCGGSEGGVRHNSRPINFSISYSIYTTLRRDDGYFSLNW
jgi:hypothetical protein